jgi:hypothetical protein
VQTATSPNLKVFGKAISILCETPSSDILQMKSDGWVEITGQSSELAASGLTDVNAIPYGTLDKFFCVVAKCYKVDAQSNTAESCEAGTVTVSISARWADFV